MKNYRSLKHTRWYCKYHIVWVPKYRKKRIYGEIRRSLGEILHDLARQRESRIEEGHMMPDHIHMMVSIPPKYSVSQVVGFMKGKSSIQIARQFFNRQKNFTGQKFWARGYLHQQSVSTSMLFANTYAIKNWKIGVLISCNCLNKLRL